MVKLCLKIVLINSAGKLNLFKLDSGAFLLGLLLLLCLFKKEFGVSPKKYVIDRRIKHAASLIIMGYFSLQEILTNSDSVIDDTGHSIHRHLDFHGICELTFQFVFPRLLGDG